MPFLLIETHLGDRATTFHLKILVGQLQKIENLADVNVVVCCACLGGEWFKVFTFDLLLDLGRDFRIIHKLLEDSSAINVRSDRFSVNLANSPFFV